jgi:hypothetical protein
MKRFITIITLSTALLLGLTTAKQKDSTDQQTMQTAVSKVVKFEVPD